MGVAPLLGMAHLTMLDVAPPDWVQVAADAGFGAVGIRTAAGGPPEQPWPMAVGSPMFTETLQRLSDTGVVVNDVELVKIGPDAEAAAYEPLFEVGAALSARFVNVMAVDQDLSRVRDVFAALTEKARPYGLRPVLEPMVFVSVSGLEKARQAVSGSGGGILLDPLHMRRFGATPADIGGLDPELLPYAQVCDAPLTAPRNQPRPARLPRGQDIGIGDLQFESRAARLLPGEGELPLVDFLRALPAGIPISIEAPNLDLLAELGPLEFARRAYRGLTALLASSAGAEVAHAGGKA